MNVKPSIAGIVLVASALVAATPATAHHSFVIFDRTKEVTLVGVVKGFGWVNPHSWIQVEVRNEAGGVAVWGVEMNSPNSLVRYGWKSTIIKPGDRVTVVVNPIRTGENSGHLVSITLPNGQVLTEGPRIL